MVEIKQIVQQAFRTGYLSIAEQNQIQVLLRQDYDSEDLDAFIILQRAIASGEVQKELKHRQANPTNHNSNIKLAYKIAAELAYAAAQTLKMPTNPQDQPSLGS
ncbi:hypothetical protein NIES2109_36610 [Nostoc sp. HK-01]|uniref:Uncharacterized protein n=2 Tax=Nostocales TaxID=1161 RepID=A0A1Z4GBU9_9CYAN|nr:hypothetical protein [Nostoc cycadae]BAY14984.1 hypothetical protein NIES21_07700 [Anabaenopsis circularis NIES-21]BBD60861.1 hypothetical protein NIES2109_36610 [Nostoc sp. HK-01]GBE91588.1 hypothetical protein NCWK1_1313 [Nostoc cycadae WK-1]